MKNKEKIIYTVKAIIYTGEKCLLLTRSHDSANGAGEGDLPGGKIKKNETPEEAMLREIYEETGLEVGMKQIRQIIPILINHKGNRNDDMLISTTLYLINRDSKENVVVNEKEHNKYEWVDLKELKKRAEEDIKNDGNDNYKKKLTASTRIAILSLPELIRLNRDL